MNRRTLDGKVPAKSTINKTKRFLTQWGGVGEGSSSIIVTLRVATEPHMLHDWQQHVTKCDKHTKLQSYKEIHGRFQSFLQSNPEQPTHLFISSWQRDKQKCLARGRRHIANPTCRMILFGESLFFLCFFFSFLFFLFVLFLSCERTRIAALL